MKIFHFGALESFALGTPVIAGRIGGLLEMTSMVLRAYLHACDAKS